MAKINNLNVCAGNIGNAFLYGKTKEKVYIIAGPEFGPKIQGKRLIIDKSLYGLKSSSARFHEHLSSTLLRLGYKPSKADYDLWIRQNGDHYEYLARYVDDVIAFSKDPMSNIQELQSTYSMKGIGKPQYYLGGDVESLGPEWEKENTSEAFSAETYITNVLPKLAKSCKLVKFRKFNIPFSEDYHPELDESDLLPPESISKYRSLLGSANWIITLGRFDIAYAINSLSRYSMAPRVGHMTALQRVFGYLRTHPKGKILIDASHPPVRDKVTVMKDHDWVEFYPDVIEDLPIDKPEERGELCTLTCYVDTVHTMDKATRRSDTEILVLMNNTPISWYSKCQKMVKSSMYESDLVASRIAVEMLISLRYFLTMVGAKIEPSSWLVGDNMAVVLNTTI